MEGEGSAAESAYEQLERDVRKVLDELLGEKSLERFRREYEKLYEALRKSHVHEKALIGKCRELKDEIVTNAQTVEHSQRVQEEDKNSISLLKKELDKAWRMVDSEQEKAKRAQRNVQTIKTERDELRTQLDQGTKGDRKQEAALEEANKANADAASQLSGLRKEFVTMKRAGEALEKEAAAATREKEKMQKKMKELRETLKKLRNECDRQSRKMERAQDEKAGAEKKLERAEKDLKGKKDKLKSTKRELSKTNDALADAEKELNKFRTKNDELRLRNEELNSTIEHLQNTKKELMEERDQQSHELRRQGDDLRRSRDMVKNANRKLERAERGTEMVAKQKQEVEAQRDEMRTALTNAQRDLKQQLQAAEADQKLTNDMQSQIARLQKNIQLSRERNEAHKGEVKLFQAKQKELSSDIAGRARENRKLQKSMKDVGKEREKAEAAAAQLHNKNKKGVERLKRAEMVKNDLLTNLGEEQQKLKQQGTLYEQVRGERNQFCQQTMELGDSISELKRKMMVMQHQIEQLKEEISTKDKALIKQHFDIKQLQDDRKSLEKQKSKKDEILSQADKLLGAQDVEIKTLRRTLVESNNQQRSQKQVFDSVVDERDILGAQLIRRNDELALIYEKIRIMESTLEKGELQYQERVEDIKILKLKVRDCERQLRIRNNQVANMDALKNEVYHLQRELLQERTKVKALSEELENPMNVHRWRKLEGSDPSALEMLQKIQTLQKRLILKTEETVEKDLLIEEKEKLYIELKNILARQPGPEVAEQLSAYQQTLKEKTRQMKAMAAELNMFQAQVNEYKYEMERVTRELQDVKRKYYEQKRKEQILREAQRDQSAADIHLAPQAQAPMPVSAEYDDSLPPKFVGGGFALK